MKIPIEKIKIKNSQNIEKDSLNRSVEAFKKTLLKQNKFFKTKKLLTENENIDFQVKIAGEYVSIGIKPINKRLLNEFKISESSNYKFKNKKVPDVIIACHVTENYVEFLGAIRKQSFLTLLEHKPMFNKNNKELFRTVSLRFFSMDLLLRFLASCESATPK